MSGPLLKVTRINLKDTNLQLKRIADGLEVLLRLAYDYNMTPPKADTSGDEPTVSHTDEVREGLEELIAIAEGRDKEREEE